MVKMNPAGAAVPFVTGGSTDKRQDERRVP
jgi:hypothetical protein